MLKNSEIDLLVKMERLIGMNEEMLFHDKENNIASGVAYSEFIDFISLIEKEIQVKKKASEKANEYNKKYPEKHREQNKEYARRRRQAEKHRQ